MSDISDWLYIGMFLFIFIEQIAVRKKLKELEK